MSYNQPAQFSGVGAGRGRGGRGRNYNSGGRGRGNSSSQGGRGRGHGRVGPNAGTQLCRNFVMGLCQHGDGCRFQHWAKVFASINAHQKEITSMTIHNNNTIITSSKDCCIGNFAIDINNFTLLEKGKLVLETPVHSARMFQSSVIWSSESYPNQNTNAPVGVVTMLKDPSDMNTAVSCKRPGLDYTHHNIAKSFICCVLQTNEGPIFLVVTGGSEGFIRIWRYDNDAFLHINVLEGHTRDVNYLLHRNVANEIMWSCSSDQTIIAWNLLTFSMVKKFNIADGHRAPVNCLELLISPCEFICSGGNDHMVKIWSPDEGECVQNIQEIEPVTALSFLNDDSDEDGYAMIAIGLKGGSILIRDLKQLDCPIMIQLNSQTYAHTAAVVSICKVGGNIISAGEDGFIIFWGTSLDPNFS